MYGRRLGLIVLVVGFALAGAARIVDPGAPPVYDGVVPIEAYVWLDPPSGGLGGARGGQGAVQPENGQSGLIAISTPEPQPQAQIFATPGAIPFADGPLSVSIEPVPASVPPSDGNLASNIYRIDIIDSAGNSVSAQPDAGMTVYLRASDPALSDGSVERFDGTAWTVIASSLSGYGGGYTAVVGELGDFAVVAPFRFATLAPSGGGGGSTDETSSDFRWVLYGGAALVAIGLSVLLIRSLMARQSTPPPSRRRDQATRPPRKPRRGRRR